MTAFLTDDDIRMRDAVLQELASAPDVDASAVAATALDGAVTLSGFVETYAAKLAAERAAKRVPGVRAVANGVEVRLRLPSTDADIAQNVVRALQFHRSIPGDVQASVQRGVVTLTGHVERPFQKRAALEAISQLRGIRRVMNYIVVTHDVNEPLRIAELGH